MSKETEFQNKIREVNTDNSAEVAELYVSIYGKSPTIEYYESLDAEGKKAFDEQYLSPIETTK